MNILKKPFFLSILSGVLLSLSWPTYGITIFAFVAFVPLLKLESHFNQKRKFKFFFIYTYFTFLIWNLVTTWWLVNASLFGMLFANLCNSLFFTILFVIFHLSKKRLPARSSYILLISLWLTFEKLHLSWDLSWTCFCFKNLLDTMVWIYRRCRWHALGLAYQCWTFRNA